MVLVDDLMEVLHPVELIFTIPLSLVLQTPQILVDQVIRGVLDS